MRATPTANPILARPETGDLFAEPAVALPPMTLGEHVAEDYTSMGLSLKAHPCAFFRQELTQLGALTSAQHKDERHKDRRVAVAGLVLVRQRPGSAEVTFLTLEDETGIVNVVVWPRVFEANRRVVMTAQFLLVRGRLQREGLVIHVVAEEFLDLTGRLFSLRDGAASGAETPSTDPSSRLLRSRDFH